MLFLLGSIIFSTYLAISFKILQKLQIGVFPVIVYNYIACVITGSIVNSNLPFSSGTIHAGWFPWAIVMGSLFITLFNLIGYTTQNIGVAVASVANKLSMIIPVLFFIILKNEPFNWVKITGIGIALAAVLFTCHSNENNSNFKYKYLVYLLPAILFIGSGFLDTLYKYVYDLYLVGDDFALNNFLISSFGTAAIFGGIYLLYLYISGEIKFSYKTVLAGICIGIPNYFSIWFLGKVYKENIMESSAIIPVNNMAIVLASTLAAFIFFKEKLSLINWLGILFSIIAIALIAFNNYLI